jgi:hypothetical protein
MTSLNLASNELVVEGTKVVAEAIKCRYKGLGAWSGRFHHYLCVDNRPTGIRGR